MIARNSYNELKRKYWDVASWALWAPASVTPKSNMGDLSVFDDPDLLKIIGTRFVLVGLNGSGKHDEYLDFGKAWYNFHSDYSRGNDFKMRYAFQNTPVWGSYITDFIKYYQEVDSNKALRYVKSNPDVMKQNVEALKDELTLLGGSPILVALGDAAYNLLNTFLGKNYTVVKIKHYSYTIGKEEYRRDALSTLSRFF